MLPEEVAAPLVGDIAPRAFLGLPDDPQPPALDEVHPVRALALPDDDSSFVDRDALQSVDELVERVRADPREVRREAEEVAQATALGRALEMILDLGFQPNERPEDGPVEPERIDRAVRPHGRGSRDPVEQRHLAEDVARAEHLDRDLAAVLRALEHSCRAGDDRRRGRRPGRPPPRSTLPKPNDSGSKLSTTSLRASSGRDFNIGSPARIAATPSRRVVSGALMPRDPLSDIGVGPAPPDLLVHPRLHERVVERGNALTANGRKHEPVAQRDRADDVACGRAEKCLRKLGLGFFDRESSLVDLGSGSARRSRTATCLRRRR